MLEKVGGSILSHDIIPLLVAFSLFSQEHPSCTPLLGYGPH